MSPDVKQPKYAAASGGGGRARPAPPPGMEQRSLRKTDGSELFVQAPSPTVQNTVDAFEGRLQPPTPPGQLPLGLRHEHVDPDAQGRSLDVIAEDPIAGSILHRFRLPYRRDRYLAEPGLPGRFHRTTVGRWLFKTRESDYTTTNLVWTAIAAAVITGAIGYGFYLGQENANQPTVNRIDLTSHECVNVPGDSIAMGSNVSVNGEVFNNSPQSAAIILVQPSLNPLATNQVCSGNFAAAVDVVNGPAGFENQIFTDDLFSLQQTGCINHAGCGPRVNAFRR